MASEIDEAIKKNVVDQLYWDSRVNASDVTVQVEEGTVQLAGVVPGYRDRIAAVEGARDVLGVRHVSDHIRVQIPPSTGGDGVDLGEQIEILLRQHPEIDASRIQVTIDDGVVEIRGTTDAMWKKQQVEALVSGLRSVRELHNKLAVAPREVPRDEIIARDVVRSLERRALVDASALDVSVVDGIVHLSGAVDSAAGRRSAIDAGLYTAGSRGVDDAIVVIPPSSPFTG